MNSTLILQTALAHYTAEKTKTLSSLDALLNHGHVAPGNEINQSAIDMFKNLSISELCISNINSIIQNNIVPANKQQPTPDTSKEAEVTRE